MFFLILAADRPDMLDRGLAERARHLDYWTGQPGTVKVASAMLDGETPKGSAFLIEVADEQAARALVAADPFMLEGIFDPDVRIERFRPSIGEWKPG